jgi:hypothetical protein
MARLVRENHESVAEMSVHVGGRGPGHLARVHKGAGGGGGGPVLAAQSMGNQTGEWQWYIFQGPTIDLFHGEGIYCDSNAGFNTTGNIASGSKTISGIASMANITVGMAVTGTGVTTTPANTVLAVNVPGNSVTISYACTATATAEALNFTFNGQVPDAYRDSNGYPNAYPPGVTQFFTNLHASPAGGQYVFSWSGPSNATITFGGGGPSGVGSPVGNTITFTPGTIAQLQVSGTNRLVWTLGTGGHPTNFTVRPVSDPGGTFQSAFKTKLAKASSPTGPIRFMHATSAIEADSGAWDYANIKYPVDGDTQLKGAIITSANRNTLSSADWWQWRQGVPEEAYIQLCTEIARPIWYSVPWNVDGTNADGSTYTSTFLTDVAAKFATFAQTTGKKVHVENANEVWNFSYVVAHQADNEAHHYGQTAGAHTACRVVATSNITLSGTQTIDGVAVVAGDRVLVTGQTTASQNGPYVVAAGAWSRAADTIATGDKWFITAGTTYVNCSFTVWTRGAITLGTTALSIRQMLRQHRYGQKAAQVMEYFEAAFNALGIGPANGAANLLVRVAAWQNGGGTTDWDEIGGFPYGSGICDDHFDIYAVAPYFNATTGAHALANTYTGALSAVWTALYGSVDYNFDFAASHCAKAASRGKGFGIYEGGNGVGFTDQTYENTVIADTGIEGPSSYFFNEFRRRFGNSPGAYHVFIAKPANESGQWDNYGLLNNVTTDETTAPLFIPFYESNRGNFTLFDPAITVQAGLDASLPSGTVAAVIANGLLPEATVTLSGTGAGNFTVTPTTDSSGGETVSIEMNGTTPAGTYSALSITQTYNNPITGVQTKTTAVPTITISAAPVTVSDNFNGGSLDGSKWTTGIGLLGTIPSMSGASMTVTQSGGTLSLAYGTTASNHGITLQSIATTDITDGRRRYFKTVQAATHSYGMAFGTPGGSVLHVNRGNGNIQFETWISGSYSNIRTATSYSVASYPYIGFRYVSGNIHVDVLGPGLDPTVDANWTKDVVPTVAWPAGVATSGNEGLFVYEQFGAASGETAIFDGYNTLA